MLKHIITWRCLLNITNWKFTLKKFVPPKCKTIFPSFLFSYATVITPACCSLLHTWVLLITNKFSRVASHFRNSLSIRDYFWSGIKECTLHKTFLHQWWNTLQTVFNIILNRKKVLGFWWELSRGKKGNDGSSGCQQRSQKGTLKYF